MESFVATYTLLETKGKWKENQHGGRKGSSTDHVLTILWDDVLQTLEPGRQGRQKPPTTAVLCGVDFSKSFSRCSHQEILRAYQRLEAPQWIINMHAAFLKGRRMRVKVGSVLSEDVMVMGGGSAG